jgi:hypothetical protein
VVDFWLDQSARYLVLLPIYSVSLFAGVSSSRDNNDDNNDDDNGKPSALSSMWNKRCLREEKTRQDHEETRRPYST